MNDLELAVARARTYAVVGEVLLHGWTERACEALGPLIALPDDPEARAVRTQRVYGVVPPYESAFRGPDALLGGDTAAAVLASYRSFGFVPGEQEPDHAGVQCAALGFLWAAEADALRDGQTHPALPVHRQRFLEQHLGSWVDELAAAVRAQRIEEHAGLMALLVDLVHEHPLRPAELPVIPLKSDARLRDLVSHLTIPARCGGWLSVHDIQRIAASVELACGFGRRQDMLESLWFSAADQQNAPALASALIEELSAWPPSARREATLTLLQQARV